MDYGLCLAIMRLRVRWCRPAASDEDPSAQFSGADGLRHVVEIRCRSARRRVRAAGAAGIAGGAGFWTVADGARQSGGAAADPLREGH